MKNIITKLFTAATAFLMSASAIAQTNGTLTFTFTQVAHSPCYTGTKNVLAVWIQSSTGAFIKTKIRNAGAGTKDHLPTFATNSGGTANNCMAAACNVVGATSGATLSSFGTKTITWDGTDATGALVPDGTYKVTIQETWNHGGTSTATKSYTFVKGPNSDIQTPATDANFSNVSLQWLPSAAGVEENNALNGVTVYPNPSTDGIFNIDYAKATSVKVINMVGEAIYTQDLVNESGTISVDLTSFKNGLYFIYITDGVLTTERKIVLNK